MKIDDFFKKFEGSSLSYDDLIFLPGYVDFSIEEIELKTRLTPKIALNLPILSSPMDRVTESRLAIALALQGGMGVLHYNLSPEEQRRELEAVKSFPVENSLSQAALDGENRLLAAAAVETWRERAEERIEAVQGAADAVVFDTAQGFTSYEIELIGWVKKCYPHLDVIAGNAVTEEACRALIEAGADAVRIGMGCGSICTTQEIGGIGRGQATAVYACAKACRSSGVGVIADGSIAKSSDLVKALGLGAHAVMLGSLLACTEEAPGLSYLREGARFKEYRGMGSKEAMLQGGASRYGVENCSVRVPEGVFGLVVSKGPLAEWVASLMQAVKQGFHKLGCRSLEALQERLEKNALLVEKRSEEAKREGGVHSLYLGASLDQTAALSDRAHRMEAPHDHL